MRIENAFDAIVIGTGCAGYNAAGCLFENGIKSVAILSEGRLAGTSRNTGSDKQTYFKLSTSGDETDAPIEMAKALFADGAVDGDVALCEAAGSLLGFYRLAALGVEFPQNEYGEFVGYRTDHDSRPRASSVGPYTSKRMTEVLERRAQQYSIPLFDGILALRIVTKDEKVCGVLAMNTARTDDDFGLVYYPCRFVIVATGGPASIYKDRVYPVSHTGYSSLLLESGVTFSNVAEWQYGLASTQFRWNLSGTYQQVLPRYISLDSDGNTREFLYDYYDDPKEALRDVFLKGYEWPFHAAKKDASSRIDLCVYRESVTLGRRVFLDFTKEPTALLDGGFDALTSEAYEYLKNSDALIDTPIARLLKMNAGAYELYKTNGIDLTKEPLEIAVCAQHNNGGADVDANWQTNLDGVYVAGEAASTHGVTRPGGSALNSTQVSGDRIAKRIAKTRKDRPFVSCNVEAEAEKLRAIIRASRGDESTVLSVYEKAAERMSADFAFLRYPAKMAASLNEIKAQWENFSTNCKWKESIELPQFFKTRDTLLTQLCYADGILYAANKVGSRGGALVLDAKGDAVTENLDYRAKKILTQYEDGEVKNAERAVRPIPFHRELWFEKVWNATKEEK